MKAMVAMLLVCIVGCATDPLNGDDPANEATASSELTAAGDDQTSDLITPPGGAETQATASFVNSCRGSRGITVSGNAIIEAHATGGCRRFNGSFSGAQQWFGSCTGDVSNCNGTLVCQSHCP